jgi:hypothetical protein
MAARDTPLAKFSAAVGVLALIIGLFGWRLGWFDHLFDQPLVDAPCSQVFGKAHQTQMASPFTLTPPPQPGLRFIPDQQLPGRVDAVMAWQNAVPVQKAGVAVSGHYGEPDPSDDFIDHTEPGAASGQCWDWYHYAVSDDAQPRTIRVTVKGLWPGQNYCFYASYKDADGNWSRPTDIFCQNATWDKSWGTPARLPS